MPGIAHIPFPSFMLVLTSNRVVVPGASVVQLATPAYRTTNDLMTTLQPNIEAQQFMSSFHNDSALAVVHGKNETEMAEVEVEGGGSKVVSEDELRTPSWKNRATRYISKIVEMFCKPFLV